MQKLVDLISTLETQNAAKADYILPAGNVRINGLGELVTTGTHGQTYLPNEVWHDGAAAMLDIPKGYYRRMQAQTPELLADSVNQWLDVRGKSVMLRTFEGSDNIARAILSNSYNILDNYDVLFAALAAIKKAGVKVNITDATVTDRKLYLVVTCPDIQVNAREVLKNYLGDRNLNVGDGIISGFVLSNSEVGQGSYEINPRAEILKCANGMICTDDKFRRVHMGAKLGDGKIVWSAGTKQKNYDLVISQTMDAIEHFVSHDYLNGMVRKLETASTTALDRPMDTVINVCQELAVTDAVKQEVLKHFIEGGDTYASGVFQAVTWGAKTLGADDRYSLEASAFNIIPNIKKFDHPTRLN
jgi:hypothetical protein